MVEDQHTHDEVLESALDTPMDAESQALSEALRSSFGIVKLVMVLLIAVFFGSGFFTVGPQEQAMIIRLGNPVGGHRALLGPGLHWSLPYPIDEHIKVPITAIQKVSSTVGWYATTPEQEMAGTEPPVYGNQPINPLVDGYVLTADRNIIHARATLTYHISDPVGYVFNFVSASNSVQNALDNALLSAGSTFNVDDILTRNVTGFKEAVLRRATELLAKENMGIEVDDCQVRSTRPRQLKDAFESVLKALDTRGKTLNNARNYENQTVSRASADAQSLTNSAESDRVRMVNEITSQAQRFNELLPKYRENPSLFVQQRLSETMGRVLTNVQDKIFLTESMDGKPKELRLMLNREKPKPAAEAKP
jgi:membrane protease subunit HflK